MKKSIQWENYNQICKLKSEEKESMERDFIETEEDPESELKRCVIYIGNEKK